MEGTAFVGATENQIFLENLPGLESMTANKDNFTEKSGTLLKTYVNWAITTSVILGSMLAVGYIILGGITYMTTDSFTGKSQGKEHLTNAIMGLIFLIGGYIIFSQLNPNILNIDFSAAKAMVKVTVVQGDVAEDWDDPDNYDDIVAKLKLKGYGEENCGGLLGDYLSSSEAKQACEERRKKETRETSKCFMSDVGLTTTRYCYMVNLRAAEKTCKSILENEKGFECNFPCHEQSCESGLRGELVRLKYVSGAETEVCLNPGEERSTGCIKGEKIDLSIYYREGHNLDDGEAKEKFNELKNEGAIKSDCSDWKEVYYDYDYGDFEWSLYINKSCKK